MKSQMGIDIIYIPIIFVFIAILFIAGAYVAINAFPTMIEAGNVSGTKVANNVLNLPASLNVMAWSIFLALGFTLIITAWRLNAHPIFWGIGALSLIVGIYIAVVLKHSTQSLLNTTLGNQTQSTMTASFFAINNLPIWIGALGVLALTLTYIAWRHYGEGGVYES